MREIFIDKNYPYFNRPRAFYILVFSVFVFGGLIAYFFIPPERKILEVSVEKIKYVDRVVEVPIEKVKYVDRVVEKRVEVPIEKKVEVPVEKNVYLNSQNNSSENPNWSYIKKGMSTEQVRRLLGDPVNITSYSFSTYWHYEGYVPKWGKCESGWVSFDSNGCLTTWHRP
jgi:hypothetical protein